jgi:hypothetical protein
LSSAGDIDGKSSFSLNPAVPERFRDIHLRSALLLVTDSSGKRGRKGRFCINANLEVLPLTEDSRVLFGLTLKPAALDESAVDEDEDGRIDEKRYSSGDRLIYSISLDYNSRGDLIREAWYDSEGRITSDYGPGFRMYNYAVEGRLVTVTNHNPDGGLTEVFGVARMELRYGDTNVVVSKFFNSGGKRIAVLRGRAPLP